MSYCKSIPGLLSLLFFLSCNSQQKPESHSTGSIPEKKDSISIASKESATVHYGIYLSKDYGATWEAMSAGLPEGAEPSGLGTIGPEIVLATKNAGLFITENKRTSWKDIGLGLPVERINTLLVSGEEIYIGLYHEGISMRKPQDRFWNNYTHNLPNRNVRCIVKLKDELLVGTDSGLFKSANNKETWNAKIMGELINGLAMQENNIYACTRKGLVRSTDGGENWNYILSGKSVHKIKVVDGNLYVLQTDGIVVMSDNFGQSWREIKYGASENAPVEDVIRINDFLFLSTPQGLLRSDLKGRKWELAEPTGKYLFTHLITIDQMIYGVARTRQE